MDVLKDLANRLNLRIEDIEAIVIGLDISMGKVKVFGNQAVAKHMQTLSCIVDYYPDLFALDIELEDKPNVRKADRLGVHYDRDEKAGVVIVGYPKVMNE